MVMRQVTSETPARGESRSFEISRFRDFEIIVEDKEHETLVEEDRAAYLITLSAFGLIRISTLDQEEIECHR